MNAREEPRMLAINTHLRSRCAPGAAEDEPGEVTWAHGGMTGVLETTNVVTMPRCVRVRKVASASANRFSWRAIRPEKRGISDAISTDWATTLRWLVCNEMK